MSLQEIYYVAEMVVGLAVIASIVFVAIELRQNSYMLKKSMSDQRRQRIAWTFETLVTDHEFRTFHRRIDTEWDRIKDDDDELYRATCLGIRNVRSVLDELVAYFDGQITSAEYINLEWNMRLARARPNNQRAYEIIKDAYPSNVQGLWESTETMDSILLKG